MTRFTRLSLIVILAFCLLLGLFTLASAQVVPDTADPYELAPQNVHLYPISLNARIPYYYLPPIFAPTPMWRGALDAELLRQTVHHECEGRRARSHQSSHRPILQRQQKHRQPIRRRLQAQHIETWNNLIRKRNRADQDGQFGECADGRKNR